MLYFFHFETQLFRETDKTDRRRGTGVSAEVVSIDTKNRETPKRPVYERNVLESIEMLLNNMQIKQTHTHTHTCAV